MTMTDAAAAYLAKAVESLAGAENEFVSGRYNNCANRCYYACFQAAIAALVRVGVRSREQWGHDFVQAQFAGQLINRRKFYGAELRNILPRAYAVRRTGDYDTQQVTRTDAERALARTRLFVQAILAREGR